MYLSTSSAALSSAAILLQLTSAMPTENLEHSISDRALGINCRGSGSCGGAHLDFIVNATGKIDMGKMYHNGDHIACWVNDLNGGECAFLQNTQSGQNGSRIRDLILQLQGHNCKDCGSVPITFPQSNDPSPGILTVNYVDDVGACDPADGICDDSHQSTSSSSVSKSSDLATPASTPASVPAAPSIYGSRELPDPTLWSGRKAMTPYLYACSSAQQQVVKTAWQEAGQMAEAHAQWKAPRWFGFGSYQPAMDMYVGNDSRRDTPWFGTGPLMQNVLRQKGIHVTDSTWSPYWSYAYIYCDESQVPRKQKKPEKPRCNSPLNPGKKVTAFTFPDYGGIFGWNAQYIVLCPRFFDNDILSLSDMVNHAKSNSAAQKVMEPWRKVKARVIFHETYHWGPAEVSNPICDRIPEVYNPSDVVNLASTENVAGSRTNAESWAEAAMAIYVQRTFNLNSPPAPEKKHLNLLASVNDTTYNDDLEEQFFDSTPDWFQSPINLNASSYGPRKTNSVLLSDVSD